jgi:hypothetical protein
MERKAALPIRAQEDDLWEQLLRIAESGEPAVRAAFLAAIAKMRGRARDRSTEIEAALERGDVDRVLALLYVDELVAALTAAEEALDPFRARAFLIGRDSAKPSLNPLQLAIHLGARTELAITFQHVSADVLAAIRTATATRVQGITAQTTGAIRAMLERAFVSGARSRTIVPELMTELTETIGLTVRQEAAVARYAAALADAETPASVARQAALVSRYRKTLLKQRASMIARSETMQAMNDGQHASWRTLVERGLLDDSKYEREWVAIVPTDGRTCPICEALDGERAPIGGVYTDPAGEGGDGPINHPDCRCVEKLVPVNAV